MGGLGHPSAMGVLGGLGARLACRSVQRLFAVGLNVAVLACLMPSGMGTSVSTVGSLLQLLPLVGRAVSPTIAVRDKEQVPSASW